LEDDDTSDNESEGIGLEEKLMHQKKLRTLESPRIQMKIMATNQSISLTHSQKMMMLKIQKPYMKMMNQMWTIILPINKPYLRGKRIHHRSIINQKMSQALTPATAMT